MTQPPVPDERRPASGGSKAAARNRAALIAAAREIYAQEGLDAPLSAIARQAGVGQGVLYRHFPNRDAVAGAVLEENVRQIEQAAAAPDATSASVLGVLTWHLAESAAFIGLLSVEATGRSSKNLAHSLVLSERVERALDGHLPDGGLLREMSDLTLAVAMVSGAVAGHSREERQRRALAAWRLLGVTVGPVRPFEE
ncbi:TetR/AcrR family transcriptional regulator [Streptomyces sp. NPDC002680]|uniref:TetR/AcrR family transcriptional regulator n=1 Tax=Streptomyces sp. NPDC002680 TaxID=3364659 RepID=UPI0036ABD64F